MAGIGLNAFKSVAKDSGTKKKSDRPEIQDPTLDEAITKWLQAKIDLDSAEATKAIAESVFLTPAVKKIIDASIEGGEPQSSVAINGKVMVSIQNKYSKIAMEVLPRLEEIFGDTFKDYFEEKMDISLTEAALADADLLTKLAEAVGAENIEKYFSVKRYMAPRPNFHHDRLTRKVITTKATKAMEEGILSTPKGSVKKM